MTSNDILIELDKLVENPHCELNYNKDYELLIATLLSAQSTDKRVNSVTEVLFSKYDIFAIKDLPLKEIENIIHSVGTYKRKSIYIKELANILVDKYNGIVPNDRLFLESLPGVGRKTTNVVLANLYNVPTIPVDTHVLRVSKRLAFIDKDDDVIVAEQKLMKKFPRESWNKLHNQLIFLGRYICTSRNPQCIKCPFKAICVIKKI